MKVYLIGIAGTGMGAFAGLLKQAGHQVLGSDKVSYPPMKEKLLEWGIEVKTPYDAKNLDPKENLDFIVVGNVVSKNHVEVEEMQRQSLPYKSFPAALREVFLEDKKTVVVTGTHGKTTISALLSHVITQAGLDPSFLIGGIPKNFGESYHMGQGELFVLEGDEYDTAYFDKGPKFLHYKPEYLLCSSLEFDHADIYQNVDQIVERFAQVISLVPKTGVVVLNNDSHYLQNALEKADLKAKLIKYNRPEKIKENSKGLDLEIDSKKIFVPLSGEHNAQNALGSYRLLQEIGLTHEQIKAGFASFKGVKRRMEEVGERKGRLVIDDFAHHPSAVKATLAGAKNRYKNRPLWAIFEPRSASSCRQLFQEDYAKSFILADRVLLAPTGRDLPVSEALDMHKLAKDIGSKAVTCDSIDQIIEILHKETEEGAVLLCMSNGSFGNIHTRILQRLLKSK